MALSSTDSAARTPEMPPIERAETIPARWHVDERFHAFDREAIFNRHWQYVRPASDLEAPGDYVQVEIVGNPVVVVWKKPIRSAGSTTCAATAAARS